MKFDLQNKEEEIDVVIAIYFGHPDLLLAEALA
jgi:hypothetical protein